MISSDQPFRDSVHSGPPARAGQRALGAILIDAGRLDADDTASILEHQRERGLRFGQAAISLGLLTDADIALGLARQFDFPYLLEGASPLSDELVLAYQPFGEQAESIRVLRSELLQRWFGERGRHALAITSTAPQEGRSFLAANLAIAFSQLGKRTLLIDADLRNPRQQALFRLADSMGLSALLSGRAGLDVIASVPGLLDLSVLSAGMTPPNPTELLARPAFAQLLAHLGLHYDVVLIDTPPALNSVDARSVAARAGAAVVVARQDESALSDVTGLAATMTQSGVAVLGAVLNAF